LGAKKVVIAARRLDELERVKKECDAISPNKVLCLQMDLANPDEVLKAAE